MKLDEGKLLLMLSGVLSGIVITSLFLRTAVSPSKVLTYEQYQRVNCEYKQLVAEIKGLDNQYIEIIKKLENYESTDGEKDNIIDTLKNELNDVKNFYGVTDAEGPGIILTIDDRRMAQYNDYDDLASFIVHDFDLRTIIAELKNAGAEAVSVNGIRIMDNSYILCSGPIIDADRRSIVPPFTILAIGDPAALQYALSLDSSHFCDLTRRKLPLKVTPMKNIVIKSSPIYKTSNYINDIQKPVN